MTSPIDALKAWVESRLADARRQIAAHALRTVADSLPAAAAALRAEADKLDPPEGVKCNPHRQTSPRRRP